MSPSLPERSRIANDTLQRTEQILHQYRSGSSESTFVASQLPPLDKSSCPNNQPSTISVLNSDSFTVARDIIRRDDNAKGKTAVLNLASDELRAGGWVHSLSKTQVCLAVGLSCRPLSIMTISPPLSSTGRSAVLLLHFVCHVKGGILSVAKHGPRFNRWYLLSSGSYLQG